MKKINLNNMEFIKFVDDKVNILFSTAENDISYKLKTKEGKENLDKLKEIFDVDNVIYTNQIHSSIVFETNKDKNLDLKEGDGIVSNNENEIIGVFTADCVPVILYDKKAKVISAVHSGWKGTIGDISKKAAELMKSKYGAEDINVIIGPHIRECCYEVSNELVKDFTDKYGRDVANLRMLNLENAIKKQLEFLVNPKNIKSIELCTNCNKDYKLHSYRKDGENAGRLFSFVYLKKD